MKQIIHASMILIFVVVLVGCKGKAETSEDIQNAEPKVSESNAVPSSKNTPLLHADLIEIVGSVTYKGIEGGFYAIDGDDGRKYDPINLPESFKKDGLKVKITARLKKDAMSFHMYGAIIEVVNIAPQ